MGAWSGHCRHAAGGADEDCGDRRYTRSFQRLLRRRVRLGSGFRRVARDFDLGIGRREKRELDGPAADTAAARARYDQDGRPAVRRAGRMAGLILLVLAMGSRAAAGEQVPQDNDHTLQAMRDEMARAKTRLELKIPNVDQPVRPYYVGYRLLDLHVREVVAEYGALLSSTQP